MTAPRPLPTDEEWIASGDADRNAYGCWLDWCEWKRRQFEKSDDPPPDEKAAA